MKCQTPWQRFYGRLKGFCLTLRKLSKTKIYTHTMPHATAQKKAVLNEVMRVLEDETNDDINKIGFLIAGGIMLALLREVERLLPDNKK